jgi:PmbA protein
MRKVVNRIKDLLSGKKSDAFEIAAVNTKSSSVQAKDLDMDLVSRSESTAFALRVLRESRLGYAYSTSDAGDALANMVEGAIFSASSKGADEFAILPEGPHSYPSFENPPREQEIPLGSMVDFAIGLEKDTKALDKRITRVRYSTLTESLSNFTIYGSRGIEGEFSRSTYVAFVYAIAEEGDQSETGFGFDYGDSFDTLLARRGKVPGEASHRAIRMLGSRRIQTGRYPVLIENSAMIDLLGVLTPSFNGKNVALKKSMLSESRGKEVFSPLLSIIDNPLMEKGAASAPFDGEGVPSRRLHLIREGRCEAFMTDSYWGKRLGTGSTGSLRRGSVQNPPEIGNSNIFISPGKEPPDGLMGKIDKGILLTNFLGIHTADTISGDFSVGASGIYIENGEMAFPVRTFAVSGNIVELMGRVTGVGSDLEMLGSTGAPTVAFEYMDVGGE